MSKHREIDKHPEYDFYTSNIPLGSNHTKIIDLNLNSPSNTSNEKDNKPIALEIGAGTNKSYEFKTKIPVSYEPLFLDIEPPTQIIRKVGNWIVGDAQYLPFRIEIFDMVYAYHVIEHLDEPEKFVIEVFRILKRGGKLELATPNFLSRDATHDPAHKHIFNILKILKMVRKVGFQIKMDVVCGSKVPKPLRIPLHLLINLLIDELRITGLKP
nr:methyltransferase domain-containing protein [Candidatus Freyarchaeota archaeon]